MPLIRCTSCAYANAMDAKVCKKCGEELRVPPHLMRCPHCGTLNPVKAAACVWCFRTLAGSWRHRLLGRSARVAVAATAVVLLAVLGYYAYPRGLPQEAARPPVAAPIAPAAPVPEPVAKPQPATEAPRADRQPGETPRAKAAPAAVARQGSARKAGESAEAAADCPEGVAALGLCGKTQARQPPRPQACTEAVAALGLCGANNIQGRE
jgi:hypothetical protein